MFTVTKQNIAAMTFLAIMLVVGLILVVAVPNVSGTLERSFLALQADVNRRQAENVANFVQSRRAEGEGLEAIRHEVQQLISNSQADRGYTCIVDRETGVFVNHPMVAAVGMEVSAKKGVFSRPSGLPDQAWEVFLAGGVSADGELRFPGDEGDSTEVVSMVAIPDTSWTVSTHENTDRVRQEILELRSRVTIVAFALGLTVALASAFAARRVSGYYERAIEEEKKQSDQLLLNILPSKIAEELKIRGAVEPTKMTGVTLLFSDLVGFTELAAETTAEQLVEVLNAIFLEFDRLADRHGVERIKTIGDSYMVGAGIPEADEAHACKTIEMAFQMFTALAEVNDRYGLKLGMRVGVNSGPVVAGVIGQARFAYDLWGETVNVASRLESTGQDGRVHVSESTRELLDGVFDFEERGWIDLKGIGQQRTFFAVDPRPHD